MTVKNWTFAYNTTPTDQTTAQRQAASLHFQRKEFLVAGGWTVTRSSDGDAGRTDFSGDNVTDVTTDFVWAASGARSWMELKSPEGFYAGLDGSYTGDQSRAWLTVHLNNADVTKAEIFLHNVVPTGTASASACPTSTNRLGYAGLQMLRAPFNGSAIFHFARTSQGQWFELVGYTGAGIVPYALTVLPFTDVNHNPDTGKDFPFATMIWANFYDTDRGALDFSYGGLYVDPGTNAHNTVNHWNKLGVANNGGTIAFVGWRNASNASYPLGDTFSATNRDDFSYSFPTSELWALGRQSVYFMIGKVADIRMSTAPFAQGDTDSATNPTTVYLGRTLLPANTLVNL